jgi:hypothetical protein
MTDPGGLERYLDAVTVEARALMDGFEGRTEHSHGGRVAR